MARQADPTRATRKTGNRPLPGEAKVQQENLPALVVPRLPEPPADLPEQAQAMFRTITAELMPRGLREADLESVAMMCHSAYLHHEARANIARYGILIKGPRGPVVNPLIKVARDEAQMYLRIANEFGLTLAARLRLGLMQLAGESILDSLNKDLDR